MGRWNVSPADSESWHGIETSNYFKKIFGITKGTLVIQTLYDNGEHGYFPKSYFKQLSQRMTEINRHDYRALEKILKRFYDFVARAKKEVAWPRRKDLKNLSNAQLIKMYKSNRSWEHRVAIYDQLGWIAEDHWKERAERILVEEYKLKKNSSEYYRVLFALSKPERISTTLEEKKAGLEAALRVAAGHTTLAKASDQLAKDFGWLPVAAYGTPWIAEHYKDELKQIIKRSTNDLKNDISTLKNYTPLRNKEYQEIIKRYRISPQSLQVFIDFGLVTDVRNEAEYFLSYAGFYLIPLYKEIARRLALSIGQVRNLYEDEIVAALQGKIDPLETLRQKGKIIGWGFNPAMTKRINFTTQEAAALFDHIEKNTPLIQGSKSNAGICASPGTARGVIKVVHSPTENYKVKNGDIMIAHTTMVDFLPAMKKAAAIVTEVGGLTCHAAVVSREFGVPCIVGLKDATKNFKDGQKVEVIADKGLITILK